MKNNNIIVLIAGLITLGGCATNPYKVTKLVDLEVDGKGNFMGGVVGLDKDKQAVIQTRTPADEEARLQLWKNADLKDTMRVRYEAIQQCLRDKADPRLGGSGEVSEVPEIDVVASAIQHQETLGLDTESKLVIVKQEMFKDKLEALRKDERALLSAIKIIQKNLSSCSNAVGAMRVKAGLPREKSLGIGHYDSEGHYVMERRMEMTLDDAFEFAGRKPASNDEE